MSLRFPVALAALFALSAPLVAADPPAKKPDPAEALVAALFEAEVTADDLNVNVNDTALFDILQRIAKRHNITFVVNEASFKADGIEDIKERKPAVAATQLRGLSLHQFLTLTLGSVDATYLVKNGAVEIVTPTHAARVTKSAVTETADGRKELARPLVSAVFKEKPLNEALATLAERYDLNIVVAPQSADAKTGFVSARLLNVPADKALELLAVQADLRVVRKGEAFLVTSRDHDNEMFGQAQERARQKIELEKFRDAPPPKPDPEPKAEN